MPMYYGPTYEQVYSCIGSAEQSLRKRLCETASVGARELPAHTWGPSLSHSVNIARKVRAGGANLHACSHWELYLDAAVGRGGG